MTKIESEPLNCQMLLQLLNYYFDDVQRKHYIQVIHLLSLYSWH